MKFDKQEENKDKELKLSASEIKLQNQALEKIRKGLADKKDKTTKPDKKGNNPK